MDADWRLTVTAVRSTAGRSADCGWHGHGRRIEVCGQARAKGHCRWNARWRAACLPHAGSQVQFTRTRSARSLTPSSALGPVCTTWCSGCRLISPGNAVKRHRCCRACRHVKPGPGITIDPRRIICDTHLDECWSIRIASPSNALGSVTTTSPRILDRTANWLIGRCHPSTSLLLP